MKLVIACLVTVCPSECCLHSQKRAGRRKSMDILQQTCYQHVNIRMRSHVCESLLMTSPLQVDCQNLLSTSCNKPVKFGCCGVFAVYYKDKP